VRGAKMPMRQRLFVNADALPFWMALWGAVSATALGAVLIRLPEVLLICAAIGAVPSGFAGIWIRLSMTNRDPASEEKKKTRLVITALVGVAIGVLALLFLIHEFLNTLSFGE
jgi:hypothetical protein